MDTQTPAPVADPAAAPAPSILAAPEGGATPAPAAAPTPEPIADPATPAPEGGAPVTPAEGAAAPAATDAPKSYLDALPEDWRAQAAKNAAGEDGDAAKIEKLLGRFTSMDAVVKALADSTDKIRNGQITADARPGEEAGEEALTAWREERGVPATADGYEMKMPEGVIAGEADKAVFENMRGFFHEADIPADQVNGMMEAWHNANETQRAAVNQRQQQQLTDAQSQLRDTWGSDFEPNMAILDSLLGQMPQETRELFEFGTLADGSPLTSNPAIVSFLVAKEREANPVATSVPSGGGTIQTIAAEIKDIETKHMGTDAWYRDEAMQSRYRELVDAQSKYNAKHG